MNWEMVIGLEIHAELLTHSKVFCGCSAEFGGEENTRVYPRCIGLPGTLPLLNRGAVELAVKAGLALNCNINNYSAFDRKNYFYPDLPKAYQITQFEHPICTDGVVDIGTKKILINRIHIEEDAGKLIHDEESGLSLADYNRCGVPLIEIVTEPDIRSAEEAKAFVSQVALNLKYAGVCDCKMEQGSLRCDVNLSVRQKGATTFGTRTEIKNLNSFRSIVRAINFEAERQKSLLEKGERIIQQTLHYNDATGEIKALRSKEEAHDYRYFPEPDIMPIFISDTEISDIKASMPEMPAMRKSRYEKEYNLSAADADLIIESKTISDYFEAALEEYNNPKSISNMILVELLRSMNDTGKSAEENIIPPKDLALLCKMADEGMVSRNAAKDILKIMFATAKNPMEIAKENQMLMSNDTSLVEAAVDELLLENAKAVAEYKAGSLKVFGFLMGQMCKKLGKSANPAIIKSVLEKKLKE